MVCLFVCMDGWMDGWMCVCIGVVLGRHVTWLEGVLCWWCAVEEVETLKQLLANNGTSEQPTASNYSEQVRSEP